jgi:hypothetical protein
LTKPSPTSDQVKNLRELSGVGMMACHKALMACYCYEDLALDWLRKQGLAIYIKHGPHPTEIIEQKAVDRWFSDHHLECGCQDTGLENKTT